MQQSRSRGWELLLRKTAAVQNQSSLWLLFFSLLGEESHEVIVLPWNPLDFYHSRKPSMLDKLKLFRFQ